MRYLTACLALACLAGAVAQEEAPWLSPPKSDDTDTGDGPCGLVLKAPQKVTACGDAELREGRVFAPARMVFEALGAKVEWEERTVRVRLAGRKVSAVIGSRRVWVNGSKVALAQPLTLEDGRAWVAVRSLTGLLAATVEWNAVDRVAVVQVGS
ncbi:MAG: copper amine oxidase N-terminal domain-containing protein [Armatimonadetes bacterium]|nr:copper amine oxidase N-terminal domain-containing protein [Armatimonadota bacterium]